ncbi:hypothetical protein ACOALZ_14330 [Nocardiopsis algeriensis]|uniref:hypothetical protein n=1 Tax=Nocardiopsis algeriensis TaxID=1478215 RepID=UPI003B43D09C
MPRNVLRFLSLALAAATVLLCGGSVPQMLPAAVDHRDSFGSVAWQRGFGGVSAPETAALPGGVAVVRAEGVVALSGDDGRTLWDHQDGSLQVTGWHLAEGGRHLALHLAEDPAGQERLLRLLDSYTGAVVDERTVAEGTEILLTEDLAVEQAGAAGGPGLVAHPLHGGEPRWELEELRCETGPELSAESGKPVAAGGAVVIRYACTERPGDEKGIAGTVALAAGNGRELWRTEESVDDLGFHLARMVPTGEGRLLMWGTDPLPDLVDAATGRVLAERVDLVGTGPRGHAVTREEDGRRVLRGPSWEKVAELGPADGPADGDPVAVLGEGLAFTVGSGTDPEAVLRPWEAGAEDIRVDLGIPGAHVSSVESVPGAVVVAYQDRGGGFGLLGLR